MWFCKHKYGNIQKDGYQYCIKCNKAFYPIHKCTHMWGCIREIQLKKWDKVIGHKLILQCEKCGDIKKVKT